LRQSHPWPVTLAVYPGRTLACGRAQMRQRRVELSALPRGGIALTGASRRPNRRCDTRLAPR